jgi:hypothetical protein
VRGLRVAHTHGPTQEFSTGGHTVTMRVEGRSDGQQSPPSLSLRRALCSRPPVRGQALMTKGREIHEVARRLDGVRSVAWSRTRASEIDDVAIRVARCGKRQFPHNEPYLLPAHLVRSRYVRQDTIQDRAVEARDADPDPERRPQSSADDAYSGVGARRSESAVPLRQQKIRGPSPIATTAQRRTGYL